MSGGTDEPSDAEYVRRALAGDQAAYGGLMRRHRAFVYRLARGHTGDADEALDVTQEVFVAAFRALASYDPARPVRAWLARIAINKSRDWHRRRRVRHLFGLTGARDDAAAALIADDAPLPDARVADAEEVGRIATAIAALPPRQKEVLLLRAVEGMSQAEVAALFAISGKAVETRLYRARAALAVALAGATRGAGPADA